MNIQERRRIKGPFQISLEAASTQPVGSREGAISAWHYESRVGFDECSFGRRAARVRVLPPHHAHRNGMVCARGRRRRLVSYLEADARPPVSTMRRGRRVTRRTNSAARATSCAAAYVNTYIMTTIEIAVCSLHTVRALRRMAKSRVVA